MQKLHNHLLTLTRNMDKEAKFNKEMEDLYHVVGKATSLVGYAPRTFSDLIHRKNLKMVRGAYPTKNCRTTILVA